MGKRIVAAALLALLAGTPAVVGSSLYQWDTVEGYYVEWRDGGVFFTPMPQETVAIAEYIRDSGVPADVNFYKLADAICQTRYPRLLTPQGRAESGFNPRAVSPKGAKGVFQILEHPQELSVYDYYGSAKKAERILRDKIRENGGDLWLGVERYCGVGQEARDYRTKVRDYHRDLVRHIERRRAAAQQQTTQS